MVGSIAALEESYWLCPLCNFRSYPDNVDFDKGFQIKSAWQELKEEILICYPDWAAGESFDYMVMMPQSERFGLEIRPVNKVLEIIKIHKELFKFVTALRLCNNGRIILGPLVSAQPMFEPTEAKYSFETYGWQNVPTEFGYLYGFIDLTKPQARYAFNKPIYRLRKSDIPLINKTMHNIDACLESTDCHSLYEILRRFNSSYYSNFENRLIDHMIAFESLYIADDKELGYKLALRTAFLLGKNRTKIFNDMKKAYDLRGQIVHGSKPADRAKLEETVPKTEDYLRRSIQKFLFLSKKYPISEISKRLDENILKSGKPLAIKE